MSEKEQRTEDEINFEDFLEELGAEYSKYRRSKASQDRNEDTQAFGFYQYFYIYKIDLNGKKAQVILVNNAHTVHGGGNVYFFKEGYEDGEAQLYDDLQIDAHSRFTSLETLKNHISEWGNIDPTPNAKTELSVTGHTAPRP